MSDARTWWKIIWRRIRVARREALKAQTDCLLYGTGAVMVPSDGSDPRHIPLSEIKDFR